MFASSVIRTAAIGLVMTATIAAAKGDRVEPEAQARAQVMQIIAKNAKVLGDMAGGKSDFDAEAAGQAGAALKEATGKVAEAYKVEGADDPASEAAANIWTDWEGFMVKVNGLEAGAQALDVASLEALSSTIGGVTSTCRDCHESYRE